MRRRVWVVLAVIVGLLGLGGWVSAAEVSLSQKALAGMSTTGKLPAVRAAVWYQILTPAGICQNIVPNCDQVEVIDRDHFRLHVTTRLEVPTNPTASLWLDTRVLSRRAPRSMTLSVSASSEYGSASGRLGIRLAKSRANTRMTVSVLAASGRGLLGQAMRGPLAQGIASGFAYGTRRLQASHAAAQVKVRAKWTGKHGRITVSPKFDFKAVTTPTPTAQGAMRVYVDGHRACTTRLNASGAKCRIRRPQRGARVTVVTTGVLSNGFELWHSTTRRFR